MAQQQAPAAPALRSSFRYTPGDGHAYEWSRGQTLITVSRVSTGERVDTIPFQPDPCSAAAFMAVVDGWAGR
jgi:hypothetical protein